MAQHRYHGTPTAADWRQSRDLTGNFVGVEIETHNEAGSERTVNAVDKMKGYEGRKSVCEADGSICHYRGTEVITPPIPLAQAVKKDGYLSSLITTLLESGVTIDPEKNYGLHINVNVRGWGEQDKHLLTYGVHILKGICQKIGGRTGEAREGLAYWQPIIVKDDDSFITDHNKYKPAWLRNNNHNVVEIRYPKAVVDFDKIKTNISFIYALRGFFQTEGGRWLGFYCAFCTERGLDASALFQSGFIAWLAEQKNFRNLFSNIGIKQARDKAYTLQETKDHAKASLLQGNPIIQKQAVQWCDLVAERNPIIKAD